MTRTESKYSILNMSNSYTNFTSQTFDYDDNNSNHFTTTKDFTNLIAWAYNIGEDGCGGGVGEGEGELDVLASGGGGGGGTGRGGQGPLAHQGAGGKGEGEGDEYEC